MRSPSYRLTGSAADARKVLLAVIAHTRSFGLSLYGVRTSMRVVLHTQGRGIASTCNRIS